MRNQPSLLNIADTNIVGWFQVLRGQQHLGPVWEMVLLWGPWNSASSSYQRVSCLFQIMISPDITVSIFKLLIYFQVYGIEAVQNRKARSKWASALWFQ